MSDERPSVYIDRPNPGRGYVVFLMAMLLLMLVTSTFAWLPNAGSLNVAAIALILLWYAFVALIGAHFHFSMHDVEYRIDEHTLHLKSGLSKYSIRLSDIRYVERGTAAFSRMNNRQSDLLRVGTPFSWAVWRWPWISISPSDIDEFVEELEARAGRKLLK